MDSSTSTDQSCYEAGPLRCASFSSSEFSSNSPTAKRSQLNRQRRYANFFPSHSFDAQLANLSLPNEPETNPYESTTRRRAISSFDLPSQVMDANESCMLRQPPISPRRARRFCTDFGLSRSDPPPTLPPSTDPPECPKPSPAAGAVEGSDEFSLTSATTTPLATPSCTLSDESSMYDGNMAFPQPPSISPLLRHIQSNPSLSTRHIDVRATSWRAAPAVEDCIAVRTVRADGGWAKHTPEMDEPFDPRIPASKSLVTLLDSLTFDDENMQMAGEALVLADDPRPLVITRPAEERRVGPTPPLPSLPPPTSLPTPPSPPITRIRRRSATLSQLEQLPRISAPSPPPALPTPAAPQKDVKVGRVVRAIRKVTSMSFQPQQVAATTAPDAGAQRHSRMNVFASSTSTPAAQEWNAKLRTMPTLASEPVMKPKHRSYAPPPSQNAFLQAPFTHRPSRSTGAATLFPPPPDVHPRSFMDLTPERRLKRQPSMSKEKMKKFLARASGVFGLGRKKA